MRFRCDMKIALTKTRNKKAIKGKNIYTIIA